jgi:ERCC4-related helicase
MSMNMPRHEARRHFAPGMRVEIRDAEWRIRRTDHASDGGFVLACEGLSELVRGREGLFLSKLEPAIRILDPRDTRLIADTSSNFNASLLYIDTLLRQSVPSAACLYRGHRGALDHLTYQYQPALQALAQPRQRILIADAVGLGKTLEAGMLTAELIARGRGKRILVLAVKSMLTQFQQEFWNRFTIPLVRLDSVGLQRVRNRVPSNHNPFHYFDKSIISIDTLKQDIEYRHYLEQAYWDIIIIDEAHNVADRGTHSQRARLAKLLSTRSDTLIMLSATPHDGKPESFASLMNMLDPTAIANPRDYASEDFRDKGLVIRRFKKEVRSELAGQFPDREIRIHHAAASAAEEAAYARLMDVSFHHLDGGSDVGQLFRTTLEKALFSSPAACLSTVENRSKRLRKRLETERDDERQTTLIEDLDTLQELKDALARIDSKSGSFSKYRNLLDVITGDFRWTGSDYDDRLVIFTESLVTLEYLARHLPGDIKLKAGQVAILRGDMRDKELMQAVEDFNNPNSPVRLLLCSDVAAEGINLHHLCHRMIHFDIPWSLMVFQQRNGRIDRYGQTRRPQIRYLVTDSEHPKVRGDQRVLEVLIEKDEQAGKNIGDPSEFLGLHNSEAEREKVAEFIEKDDNGFDIAAAFAALMEQTGDASENPLDAFIPDTTERTTEQATAGLPHVFDTDLDYAGAAIDWLKETGQSLDARIHDDVLSITAPEDFKQRLRYLPREACPEHDRFVLSPDAGKISEAIQRHRQEQDSAWSPVHYLWSLHPLMRWLSDRVLNAFGRHAAPILHLGDRLAADEHIVLIHGGFPNRRGQLLVHDWVGIVLHGNQVHEQLEWGALQQRLNLHPRSIPNRGHESDNHALQRLLPLAVDAAHERLMQRKQAFEDERRQPLAEQRQRLEQLKGSHEQQLELDLESSNQADAIKRKRRQEQQSHIDRIFKDHRDWLDNTQSLEDKPYLQVVAVFTGQGVREVN